MLRLSADNVVRRDGLVGKLSIVRLAEQVAFNA